MKKNLTNTIYNACWKYDRKIIERCTPWESFLVSANRIETNECTNEETGETGKWKNSRKFDPQPEWLITQLTPNCPYADVVAYEIFLKSHIGCHWKNTFLPARDLSSVSDWFKIFILWPGSFRLRGEGGGLSRVSTRTAGNLASTEINL